MAQKKLRKILKKVEKKIGGYRKRVYLCNIKTNKTKSKIMKTNIYDTVSREIETVYPKYITPAYYHQRFPLMRDIIIDDQEEELYGYFQREGNNLVVTVESIGFDRCPEPWRFEYPVYDEDDDFEED